MILAFFVNRKLGVCSKWVHFLIGPFVKYEGHLVFHIDCIYHLC